MKKLAGFLVAQLIAFAVAYPQSAVSFHLPLSAGSSLHALSLNPSPDPLESAISASSIISSELPSVSPANRKAILSAPPTAAAGSGAEGAFPMGTFGINIGLGLGVVYWGTGYGSSSGIAPNIILNYAVTDKMGIGNIVVGLILSWASTKYTEGGNTYKYTAFMVGARGEYHFILDNPDIGKKLDPYAGVMLGVVFNSNPDVSGANYALTGKNTGAVPGIYGGAHYYFNENFGVFSELGYEALFVFNLGVSFKFQ
jgi:hypothetical protein